MNLYDKLKCQLQTPDLDEDSADQKFLHETLRAHLTDKASVRALRKFMDTADYLHKRDYHKEQMKKKHNENQEILSAIQNL
jgi:hypothetical protein